MKKLLGSLLICFWALTALGSNLEIKVRDVMDLASYDEVFKTTISVKEEEVRQSYWIDEWPLCLNHCENYKIKISIQASPEFHNNIEKDFILVSVKKELFYQGVVVKELQNSAFVIMSGQEKILEDHFWDEDALIVRQQMVLLMN
ncbi:MAG: hypothetical protein KC505_10985 [Myxococcales bacterium]|nr:hypothetical protein [Myxococcales bacterium]USN50580.1 MAG: hypothetical protein H6731_10005 [Myxococcales bacterium]